MIAVLLRADGHEFEAAPSVLFATRAPLPKWVRFPYLSLINQLDRLSMGGHPRCVPTPQAPVGTRRVHISNYLESTDSLMGSRKFMHNLCLFLEAAPPSRRTMALAARERLRRSPFGKPDGYCASGTCRTHQVGGGKGRP